MPRIEPRPPKSEMPPITTAVIGFDVGELARGGRNRADAADEDPAGKAADEARKRVDGDQHAVDADTGELCCLGIVAHRIEPAAPGRVVEHVPEEHHEQHHEDDAEGDDRAAKSDLDAEQLQQRRLGFDVLAADRLIL